MSAWIAKTQQQHMNLLVGTTYGADPVLADVMRAKFYQAKNICTWLDIKPSYHVCDFGSGMGHMAGHVADHCDSMTLVDISPTFLNYARRTLYDKTNVDFFLTSQSCEHQFDVIYSTAVFIHFNLYDMVKELSWMKQHLKPQGVIGFDIMNTNSLNINSDRWHRHQDLYAKDFAHHQVVLHYHHADVIIELLRQLGLKVQRMIPDSETLFIIVTNETSHY